MGSSSDGIVVASFLFSPVARAQKVEGAPEQDAYSTLAFAQDSCYLGTAQPLAKTKLHDFSLNCRQRLQGCAQVGVALVAQGQRVGSQRLIGFQHLGQCIEGHVLTPPGEPV